MLSFISFGESTNWSYMDWFLVINKELEQLSRRLFVGVAFISLDAPTITLGENKVIDEFNKRYE